MASEDLAQWRMRHERRGERPGEAKHASVRGVKTGTTMQLFSSGG